MSSGLVNQLADISSRLTLEEQRASSAEGVLRFDLDNQAAISSAAITSLTAGLNYEVTTRETNVADINAGLTYVGNRVETLSSQHAYQEDRINTEVDRAMAAESALQTQLATSVVEVNARTDGLLDAKLDKVGGVISGDLNLTGGLLYIGASWRIAAVGASLEFQYSGDQGESWNAGIPFISA